jgi:protein O-mannosyl-transferase
MARKKSAQPANQVSTPPIPVERQRPIWIKHVLAAAALCVVTLLAYSNSFHTGFVIDNHFLILNDPRIRQATAANIDSIFRHTYWWPSTEGAYRPASTLSYLFNYAVVGNADRPEGYHWINFVLHFVNVLLVYAFALRFLRKFWPAIFISALWGVHPALTESVTNIIGRADLLAAMATISGFLMYLKSIESAGWRRYGWLAGLLAATTIGVYSKESAVVILGIVALYEIAYWKEAKEQPGRVRGIILGCAAITIPILVMLYQRAAVLASSLPVTWSFADNPLVSASFFRARITAIAVIAKYLWLMVWPAKLSTDYSYSQIPVASGTIQDWIAWIAVAGVVAAVLSQFKKNRLYFFFGAFAFVTFVPVANLLFIIGTIMAERLIYLPSVGIVACAVMLIYAACEKIRMRNLAPVVLCLFMAGFAARTWKRNIDWRDELSIAKAAAQASPNSFKTHFNVAVQLSNSDHTGALNAEVIGEIEKSLAIVDALPDSDNTATVYAEAGRDYINKGDLLSRNDAQGQRVNPPESMQAFNKALRLLLRGVEIDKTNAEIYRKILRATGRDPDVPVGLPNLYEQLAAAYVRLADYPKAFEAAVQARRLEPAKLDNYIVIGQTLAVQGRTGEAAVAFTEGMLASGDKSLVITLRELYKTGLDPEGCAILQTPQGIVLNSNCAPVHKNLCRASAEMSALYSKNRQDDVAEAIKSRAVAQFGCPAGQLD